jgi:NADH-quinone oxidoreductase subunit F
MDLHIEGATPTDDERAAVDGLLGPPGSGWAGGTRDMDRDGRTSTGGLALTADRHMLLPTLHAVQDSIGWISRGALNYICARLTVPPAEAWGVVTFYDLLATSPQPAAVAHVCDDIACRLHGAESLCRAIETRLGPPVSSAGHPQAPSGWSPGADDALKAGVAWRRSPCLGQCDQGSAALITRAGRTPERFVVAPVADADTIVAALRDGARPGPAPHVGWIARPQLVARFGRHDPTRVDAYRAVGGYRALERAIAMGPETVVAEVTAANLLGRGGAAFPTGRKWDAVRRQPAFPHFVVCNADESEPGTFKDRIAMEQDAMAVVEAMTICGLATGSERGFIYIRGEYPLGEARLAAAITAARAAGLLGSDIMGSGFAFDIEIRRGGGAYICGEETALFNSIEGKRGEPRSKPPFPAEVGLFGKPTVANNVETLVNVLDILVDGGAAWARTGTAASAGTRLFCVSGHVEQPGLYEVPFGTTLREIVALAGGVPGGRAIKAVLLGGAAGSFVGPDRLDLPLTFEAVREAGTTLGSGVVMVYDETADIADSLRRIAEFFRHESCGQCVPCRIGTVRQAEWLNHQLEPALNGMPGSSEAVFAELSIAMKDASICGLGQTASTAVESAMRLGVLDRPGS